MQFPKYPTKAIHDDVEGWVRLRFDLDGSGHASNVTVTGSHGGMFSGIAIEALEKSMFVEGVMRAGCETVFTFSLD